MTSHLITLAIETSNPSAGHGPDPSAGVALALVDPDRGGVVEVLGVERLAPTTRHDDALMPAIDRVCARAGVRPAQLGIVAVSIGPGGYTALRIAVVTAKLISRATGARCAGVPTSEVVSRRVEANGPFAVALASKGSTAWVTVFDGPGRARDAGMLMDASGLERLGVAHLAADRFLPDAMRQRCEEIGIGITAPVLDPVAVAESVAIGALTGPDGLHPLYPREPEAVRKWRELGRSR